jgi:hypothetical protein
MTPSLVTPSRAGGARRSRTIDAMGIAAASRELVVAAMVVITLSTLVEGPAAWAAAGIILVAVVLASLQVLGDGVPALSGPGVPIESLLAPGVAAVGIFGGMRLVPLGILLVPAALAGGWLLLRVIGTEARLLASPAGPSSADRTSIVAQALVAGFLAFAGAAALVPGALPEPGVVGAPPTGPELATLASADALVAFLLGYRLAALRTSTVRDVAWFALTSAIVVAIATVALRVMDLPRVAGPALAVLVFFLWDAVHASQEARPRAAGRIWEFLLLVVLGVAVVAWSLRLNA